MIVVSQKGGEATVETLRQLANRAGDAGRGRFLAAIGHRMAFVHLPVLLRENRAGWPAPGGWPRAYRAGGQRLIDTGRLASSWAYRASSSDVTIGTTVFYGRVLDKGGVIRPRKGRFLLLPLSPPLRQTEVRGFPQSKDAIRARYPGSFFLFGPEGPGIYRPIRYRAGQVIARTGRGGQYVRTKGHRYIYRRSIERIAAARRQVRVPAHGISVWRREWIEDLSRMGHTYFVTGTIPGGFRPSSGGRGDVGPKGGQLR